MNPDTLARLAAVHTLENVELRLKVKPLPTLIHQLVMKGETVFPNDEMVQQHLTSFSFIQSHPLESGQPSHQIRYTLDMEQFKKSEWMYQFARDYTKDQRTRAKKLEKEASLARETASQLERYYDIEKSGS